MQASILVQVCGHLRVWGKPVGSITWQWHLIDGVSRHAIAPALRQLTGVPMLWLFVFTEYTRLVDPVSVNSIRSDDTSLSLCWFFLSAWAFTAALAHTFRAWLLPLTLSTYLVPVWKLLVALHIAIPVLLNSILAIHVVERVLSFSI